MLSPMVGKMMILGLMIMFWMAGYRRVSQLNSEQAYHLAAYQRDQRKARYYYQTAWMGLAAAFMSILVLDGFANTVFDSIATREMVLSLIRAIGLGGVMITAVVWTMVGSRASQPNSDGQSLIPVPESKKPYDRQ